MTERESAIGSLAGALGMAALIMALHPVWWVLAGTNLRHASSMPWAAAVMLGILGVAWAALSGKIGPQVSAGSRRALLHAGPVGGRAWAWALAAGVPAMIAMFFLDSHACSVAPLVWNGLPGIGEVAKLPLALGIPFGITSCAVAAVAEEAAFRGYMQSDLEKRFGRISSWLMVAVAFAAFHLVGRSFADWRAGLVNWIVISVVFSALTDWSGSILPALVCHFAVDAALLSLDWVDPWYDAFRHLRFAGSIPAGCVAALIAGLLSAAALRQLRRLCYAEESRGADPSPR